MEVQIKNEKIFSPLNNQWLPLSPEEKIRQEFVCNLLNNHGYKIEQISQKINQPNLNNYVDILIYRDKNAKEKEINPSIIIVIECKSDYISIDTESFKESYNFATSNSAKIFVATNKKETKVYYIEDTSINKLKELKEFPNANIITEEKTLSNFINSSQVYSRDDFSKLLLKCHNIIRNNDKLSPESAFDEISKILFMKIRFERDNDTLIFSEENLREKAQTIKQIDHYNNLFDILFNQTKEFFKGESLFDKNEKLRIREASILQIVKELERYNLSDISDDIKGVAFEQFLGRTFRGELGQFFTPRTIVDFMTEILDPQEGELICDPCCGSGGFLIKSFEYIRIKIEKEIHNEKKNLKKRFSGIELMNYYKALESEFDLKNKDGRLYKLSHKCIYGIDANPRMARTAKMNMIMHGDGHGGVHHHDGLLNVIGISDGRFDVILTNPPFGARVDKSARVTLEDIPSVENINTWEDNDNENNDYVEKVVNELKAWAEQDNGKNKPKGKAIIEIFKTGKFSSITEVLFIERCLNLLKPGGRMGIVLPEGVLNNSNLQKVRDFIESKAKIILITSIPQDVFIASGATVKPSLLFFKKFTDKEAKQWNTIATKAEKEITKKHEPQIQAIEQKLKLKGKEAPKTEEKKKLRTELKDLQTKIETEITTTIKAEFDYQIPIAEVGKAGISTTGAEIENELIPLCDEFITYRENNPLWENMNNTIRYEIVENGKMFRIPTIGEPKEIYDPNGK